MKFIIAAGVLVLLVAGFVLAKGPSPAISVAPEHIFNIGSLGVTNTMFTSWIVVLFMCVVGIIAGRGMTVVPHMSGEGLGYLDVVQFASFTPNIGPFMEFKGNADISVECETSSLKAEKGMVRCPTGVGWGVNIEKSFVNGSKKVTV